MSDKENKDKSNTVAAQDDQNSTVDADQPSQETVVDEAANTPSDNSEQQDSANNTDALQPKEELAVEKAMTEDKDGAVEEIKKTTDPNLEKPADSSTTATTVEQAVPVSSTAKEPKKPATWPGKLALLISLIALVAVCYLYWLSLQQDSYVASNNAQVQSQVDSAIQNSQSELNQNIAAMNQKLGQLQAQAQSDQRNIDELQTRLTKSIQQVTAKQQTTRKDWLLAEVEYLLRLANQRGLMEQTATGALALLKSADKILKETDDVTIYAVRKALADDIAALEAVPVVDTEGVFLKLGALSRQVPNLRLIPISEQHKLPDLIEEVTPEVVSESWSAGLKESWGKAVDKLDKLVVIRRRDEPIEPLLSPEQTYYLQQNLLLMLEQAQLAILQKKQASYDASLNKARDWIHTYFEQKDGTTQSLLRGIDELKTLEVNAEIPDISGSLRSLKGYLAEMTQLKQQGASQ